MSRSHSLSVLALLSALSAVSFAAPKPQNWNTIDWANAVDWSKVDYGGGAPAAPAPHTSYVQGQPVTTTVIDQPSPTVITSPTTSQIPPTSPSPTPTQGSTSGSGSSGSSSGSKRGLAFNWESPSLEMFGEFPSISWGWSWGSDRLSLPTQFEFVPMLWSPSKLNEFKVPPDAKHVLSFNEPDIDGQANMPVGDAVAGHIKHLNGLSSNGIKIGAVSVSNGHSDSRPMGLDYLGDFLDQCSKQSPPCVVDFCPVHWYGCTDGCDVATDVKAFTDQMSAAVAKCSGKPVWITEFQKLGSVDQQQDFVKQAIDWLEKPEQSAIERYSYFMVKDGIMTNGGSLNGVGKAYVDA